LRATVSDADGRSQPSIATVARRSLAVTNPCLYLIREAELQISYRISRALATELREWLTAAWYAAALSSGTETTSVEHSAASLEFISDIAVRRGVWAAFELWSKHIETLTTSGLGASGAALVHD
jgi:hypothetical protein